MRGREGTKKILNSDCRNSCVTVVGVVEISKLKIVRFQNYKHLNQRLSFKGYRCESGMGIFV